MPTFEDENLVATTFHGMPVVEDISLRDWRPEEWDMSKPASKRADGLTQDQHTFLRVVVLTPGQPCSSYNDDVPFSRQKAISIRRELVAGGYLTEEGVRTKTKGRTAKLVNPTKKACELFPELLGETNGRRPRTQNDG